MAGSSAAQKIPAIVLTSLPILLLIPSFILAAYASSSRDWTWHKEYDNTAAFRGIAYRGPFATCNLQANNKCLLVHTRKPGGLCDAEATERGDSPGFCRQLILGAQLLYAGDALLGASLLLVLMLTVSTLPQVLKSRTGVYVPALFGREYRPRSVRAANHSLLAYLALLTMLLSGLSALLLLTGIFITTNDLVNLQYPSGDWYTTGNPTSVDILRMDLAGQWLIGSAPGQATAGAVLAGLASVVVALVWETPRGGTGRDVDVHAVLEAPTSKAEPAPEEALE